MATVTVVKYRPAPPLSRLLPALAWLTIAAALVGVTPVRAQTAPVMAAPALAQALALANQAALALAPSGARVEAEPGLLDPRLKLAPCSRVQAFLPAGVSPWGNSRVGLRCLQGAVAWQVFLPVTVRVWAQAAVARAPLPAGARIDGSQLTLAEVDWAATSSPPYASLQDLGDRVLARPVAAGQALRSGDLRARQWFAQGETVRLVAQGAGFAVSTEGLALNAGIEGQAARVRTESGRVVVGTPAGLRRVELSP